MSIFISNFIIILVITIIASSSFEYLLAIGDNDLYKISWKGALDSVDNNKLNNINTNNQDSVIDISTKFNERYRCFLPDNQQLNFDTSATNSSSSKSPIQVLEPLLNSNQCSYKFELFWIYELCHGKYLRQYHEENGRHKQKITQEYYLGSIQPEQIKAHEEDDSNLENRPTILIDGHRRPYVMFNMTGGTKCDLTKKNRVAKVIYVCNDEPNLELYSVKEISTCEYEAIVLSPLLCRHKDFKIDLNVQHEIRCFSVDGSPKKPKRILEMDDGDENGEDEKNGDRRRSIAYFQGRTLIIDADLLLS